MKKVWLIITTLFLMFCLAACGFNTTGNDSEQNDNRLTVVYNNGFAVIYVDNKTGCQYLCRAGDGLCLMVDEKGKPLIYEVVGENNES